MGFEWRRKKYVGYLNNLNNSIRTACITNSVVSQCESKFAFKPDEEDDEAKDILDINFEMPDIDKVMNYSIFIYNTTVVFDRVCLPTGKKYVDKLKEMTSVVDFSV